MQQLKLKTDTLTVCLNKETKGRSERRVVFGQLEDKHLFLLLHGETDKAARMKKNKQNSLI